MERRRPARARHGCRGSGRGQLRLCLCQCRGLAQRGAHQRLLVQHLAVRGAVPSKQRMQGVQRLGRDSCKKPQKRA